MTDANPRRLISSFTLAQITSMCGASASLHGSDGLDKGVVTGLGSDSRSISDGDLFVALVGERFDGHDFLEAVAEQGAAAALVSTLPDEEVLAKLPCILVEDTLVGLQWLQGSLRSSAFLRSSQIDRAHRFQRQDDDQGDPARALERGRCHLCDPRQPEQSHWRAADGVQHASGVRDHRRRNGRQPRR